MLNVTIVLPTYNEAENIEEFLKAVLKETENIEGFKVNALVVDDYSPDKTADIVKKVQQESDRVFLYMNNNRGLGNAYIAGFKHALQNLSPDILIEMDSDFSHDPKKLKELMMPIKEGYDFVIGSRYVKGGSIPDDWGLLRKMNSKYGNVFARFIAGLGNIKDCTSGFRALSADMVRKIDLDNLNAQGYSFQMNILYEMYALGAKVFEIPIDFIDRVKGKSKLGLSDVLEFMLNSFRIRLKLIKRGKNAQ